MTRGEAEIRTILKKKKARRKAVGLVADNIDKNGFKSAFKAVRGVRKFRRDKVASLTR